MRRIGQLALAIALTGGLWMAAGCEEHTIGEAVVDAVKDDGSSSKASENLTGTWTGISGSGRSDTSVTVRDVDGALSGSLKWSWGVQRNFTGTRSGNTVRWVLECQERDDWVMTLSSDRKSLTGNAKKNDGGGNAISLSR